MKQSYIRYGLNLILFIAIAFFNTQLIPFLKEVGFSDAQRGIILAVNALFAIVLQILFGYLCDRFQSMKKFFLLGQLLFTASGIAMFFFTKEAFYLHLFITSVMAAMVKVLTGLIETWMLYLDQKKYGAYRSLGAIGLCVGSPLAGWVLDTFSYIGMMIAGGAVSVLVMILAFYNDEIDYDEKLDFQKLKALLTNKAYMYMMLIYFLIYIVGSADQYIVIDKMMKLKANGFMIGVKWAIQSLMEIPFFLYANKLLEKYSPYVLLGVGIFMYGVKFVFYGFSSSVLWIIVATTLQLVTLPVVAYTSKIIFADLCPNLKASSQMIAMAIFIGGSAFVTPLITSLLTPMLGYDMTLYVFAGIAILPFVLLLVKNRVIQK